VNFFQRQDESRRLSRRLVLLFGLAVLAVIVAVDSVVFTVLASLQPDAPGFALPSREWFTAHPGVVLVTTLSVVGIIGLSSLYKSSVLNGGGGVVATSMGGVRVSADTTDALQRRLLNVVEEMSIAAGVPMPEVYLLEQESSINAFAAGDNPSNAAIAVTQGLLENLNRTELQGVIAHEFSHILNGDMRLNVRLMGLLFGLLVIALIARTVLRLAPRGRGSGKRGGGIAVIFMAAFAVLIIGYVGLFFARLIQAAVSRSRESLADASAVQFTRDPGGLRSALVKIGAFAGGSRLANPEAEEVAHMLFAPGTSRLFATHPSLVDRLKAIDPGFDEAEFASVRARLAAEGADPALEESSTAAEKLGALFDIPGGASATVAHLVGNAGAEHMRIARDIRTSLPEALVTAGRHPATAQALFLALALDTGPETRERQLEFIGQQLGAGTQRAIGAVLSEVQALEPEQRMPLLLRTFPALRQLTREARMQLMACLNGMLQREGRMSLPSYVLRKLAQVHLRDDLEPRARPRQGSLQSAAAELQTLFSVLARHGHGDELGARRAYEAGMHMLLPRERPAYSAPQNWTAQLDVALSRLDSLAPAAKEQLVEALLRTIAHDRQVTVGETELLRAVCASLHCPLPPLAAPGA
jgi:Zn-dependent protease with chaperone function